MIQKYTCKNKFNYTIKDLYIDYTNKTYKQGDLFHFGDAKKITKKALNEKIQELELSGFKEVK